MFSLTISKLAASVGAYLGPKGNYTVLGHAVLKYVFTNFYLRKDILETFHINAKQLV